MSVYFDACLLVPLQVREAKSASVRAFALAVEDGIHVSALGTGECASAISRHVRMGKFTADDARQRLALFDAWRESATLVAIELEDLQLADSLVRRFELKLQMPDAIHLALCMRNGLTLATLDDRLAEAARGIGVEVVVPG